MKSAERFFAIGLLGTVIGVACTGGVMPVQVGGPGPGDGEPKEGGAPQGATSAQPQTSAAGTGSSGSGKTSANSGSTSTGSTSTSSTASGPPNTTTSASGCMEQGTKHCSACLVPGLCGDPADNTTLLKCNSVSGSSSHTLYANLWDCICNGSCGEVCQKSCFGSGTDSSSCQSCLSSQVTSSCSTDYTKCSGDK
jgi:hypothetical protein